MRAQAHRILNGGHSQEGKGRGIAKNGLPNPQKKNALTVPVSIASTCPDRRPPKKTDRLDLLLQTGRRRPEQNPGKKKAAPALGFTASGPTWDHPLTQQELPYHRTGSGGLGLPTDKGDSYSAPGLPSRRRGAVSVCSRQACGGKGHGKNKAMGTRRSHRPCRERHGRKKSVAGKRRKFEMGRPCQKDRAPCGCDVETFQLEIPDHELQTSRRGPPSDGKRA